MTQPNQPETFVFFVKTSKSFHQGGFTFFSREEFDNAKDGLAKEVVHLMQNELAKDSKVKFESWGVVNTTTGGIAEEFTDYP